MTNSNNRALFFGAIVVAVLALAICVFYLIPGVPHPLVSSDPNGAHLKHAAAFGAIALIAIVGALVTRPKSAV